MNSDVILMVCDSQEVSLSGCAGSTGGMWESEAKRKNKQPFSPVEAAAGRLVCGCIYLFNKYLLSAQCTPDPILGSGTTVVNKVYKTPGFYGLHGRYPLKMVRNNKWNFVKEGNYITVQVGGHGDSGLLFSKYYHQA